jgi:hypothetical protein
MTHGQKRAAIEAAAWAVALRTETFGYGEISSGVKISTTFAEQIVKGWIKEGSIQPAEPGARKRKMWRADRDFVRRAEMLKRSAEENMWFVMRRLRAFAPTDIAAHASHELAPVDAAKASSYCQGLLAVGYLRVTLKASPAIKREARYALAKDTGPHAPIERRVLAMVDPNTGQTLVIGGAA